MGKIFCSSSKQKKIQILLCLHENWLTYQIDGANFNYEVKNSVNCYDVASLLPQQHCRRNVMTYSSYLLLTPEMESPSLIYSRCQVSLLYLHYCLRYSHLKLEFILFVIMGRIAPV